MTDEIKSEDAVKINNTLLRYKPYMEKCMQSLDFSKFPRQDYASRYETFYHALKALCQKPQNETIRIVELGTSRSYVSGEFEGCNSDDKKYWTQDISKWDHGAGAFTYLIAEFMIANHPKFELHTVDLCEAHIARCKHMTQKFAQSIRYYVSDSLQFLRNFKTKCDLIYVDTGDMTPIEPTANLQLQECQIIEREKLCNPDCFILIDDVRNPTPITLAFEKTKKIAPKELADLQLGKSKYSLAFLQKQNYRVVRDEYQILLLPPKF